MKLSFESDYRAKLLSISFTEAVHLETAKDVLKWRSQWLAALQSWHSPYKAMINCELLSVSTDPEVVKALQTMMTFFKGFFLKKAAGYGFSEGRGLESLPFDVYPSLDEASEALGVRKIVAKASSEDFRANIHFDNHFQQHVVELTTGAALHFDSADKLKLLKDKLTNNLMQWHSAWSLLIDCSQFSIAEELHDDFERMIKFFNGFFLKRVIGYGAKAEKGAYPFQVFRARHRAAAELESEGLFSGELADCRSRKVQAP